MDCYSINVNMIKKNPKQFWKHFNSQKCNISSNISADRFQEYFFNMLNTTLPTRIDEVEDFSNKSDLNEENPTYVSLSTAITTDEVRAAIRNLKRHKTSCPSDNLLNEYFLETVDILIGHITDCFNKVFDSGFFPSSWSLGYIVPIYKKGDKDDPSNYRGITLLSNFGKNFTSILTKRVENWANDNNIISDAQFGFRKGCSTTDAIFVLQSLIENFLSRKLRLYCAFIDLKKAFDSVYRNALWFKLFNFGLDGKVLKIFRSMYTSVKSCIKHCNALSDFFDISLGLKQGLNNSPMLFSLFIEDLELSLQRDVGCDLSLFDLCLIVMLFADDMVVLGKTPHDLQSSLNYLHEYCKKWGLEVNTDKTKIVVFRNRGNLKQGENWFYDKMLLETVDNFNYLGTVFNYTGSFSLNNQYVIGKALKAMNVLIKNIQQYDVTPSIALQLSDSFVSSSLK